MTEGTSEERQGKKLVKQMGAVALVIAALVAVLVVWTIVTVVQGRASDLPDESTVNTAVAVWDVVFIALYIFFVVKVGRFWQRKGLSHTAGILISIFLTPLTGVVVGLLLQPSAGQRAEVEVARGRMRKCPFCAEAIRDEAKVCRYCSRDVPAAA